MKVFSQLVSAQAENKASDYSSGTIGRFWLNTGSSLLKFDDGSAIRTVVTLDNTQTLTNKTLTTPAVDIPLFSQNSTPANPASGKDKLYFKSDDNLYALNAAGTEVQLATTATAAPDQSYEISNLSLACSVGTNALTIALKGKDGNNPSGSNIVGVGFRNVTITTGTYLRRTVTGALSVVVPASQTLGHVSGISQYIYVYLIDNAGTPELAVSSFPFDEGTVQTSSAIATATSATVLYSTTARTSKPIRLVARLNSNQTVAGTWAAVPTEISLTPFTKEKIQTSQVVGDTPNGHGGTNTKIRRWTNTTTTGTGITYADDATNGMTLTINEAGIYSMDWVDTSAGTPVIGWSVNSNQLTTTVSSLTKTMRLIWTQGVSGGSIAATATGRLSVGDIIRTHDDGNSNGSNDTYGFRIIKIAD